MEEYRITGQYEVKHNGVTWYINEEEVEGDYTLLDIIHKEFGFTNKQMKEMGITLVHKQKIPIAYEQIEAYFGEY